MMIIGFLLGVLLMLVVFQVRKSRVYRKVMTDLFVVGRIKQIANDKGIDLGQEYEDYKLFCKKRRIHSQSLDETIEEDLQDEIGPLENKPESSSIYTNWSPTHLYSL